jgi:Ni/Co efflux regulator RcnB
MRTNLWLTSALLITLLPTTVSAQDRMARPGPQPVQPSRPGGPQIQPPRPGNGGPQIQPPRPGNGGPQIQPPRPGNGGPQIQPPRPGPNRPRPPYNGHRPGYHRPPHYRPPVYHYPHGYTHYRRWHVGAILPSILFGSQYYFHDYHVFGLYAPPLHYRWIRYGPDLVLVNVRNGHVRDVHYGAFR